MTLKPETTAQIQAMLEADPALMAQLQSAADADNAAALLATAAAAKGITVSPTELTAHTQQAAAKHAQMSDAELEAVAGGGVGGAVLLSLISLGIACAARSDEAATDGVNCAARLKSWLPF